MRGRRRRKELISVRPARAAHLFCAADDTDAVDCVIELPPARAPIAAGDVLGRAVIYKNGVEADSVPLLANEDAARRGYFDSLARSGAKLELLTAMRQYLPDAKYYVRHRSGVLWAG